MLDAQLSVASRMYVLLTPGSVVALPTQYQSLKEVRSGQCPQGDCPAPQNVDKSKHQLTPRDWTWV